MPAEDRDAAPVRIPPPLVYLGAVLVGLLLHAFVSSLTVPLGRAPRIAGSLVLAAAGIAVTGGAIGLFKRTGQDPKPWVATPSIITTGIYRFTRNPMYVGMALLQLAIGFGLANGWVLLLLAPVLVIIRLTAIRHEEAYLERKFGAPYLEYKASVRRWI